MAHKNHCLSDEEHSVIVDPVVHYFGCLLVCERKAYFRSLRPDQQDKIKVELRRVKRLRRFVQQKPHSGCPSDTSNKQTQPDRPEGHRLVTNFERSLEVWRETLTDKNKTWNAVRKYRLGRRENCCPPQTKNSVEEDHTTVNGNTRPRVPNGVPPETTSTDWTPVDSEPDDGAKYDPSKDIRAYLTQYKSSDPSKHSFYEEDGLIEGKSQANRDSEETDIWTGIFPARKSFVHDLLVKPTCGNGENYLSREYDSDKNKLRYFHFPSNNMKWVEQAMSRYYDELDTQYGDGGRTADPPERSRANMVLRHEFWKGQQHGSHASFIHARHLRPLCELVSSDPNTAERTPKNLVLFMPILHWDTDRKYQTFAKKIAKLTGDERRKEEDEEWEIAQRRRNSQRKLLEEMKMNIDDVVRPAKMGTNASIDSVSGVVLAQAGDHPFRSWKSHKIKKDKSGGLLLKSKLAQVFYNAFRLMEEMDNYRDNMVLQEYLYQPSPLHPRRTLDQAYYCSIKNTKARDRDQVVYRETTPRDGDLHRWEYDDDGNVQWRCQDWADQPKGVPSYLDMTDQQAYKRTKLQSRCKKCFRLKKHHKSSWLGLLGSECRHTTPKDSDDEEVSLDQATQEKRNRDHCKKHGCQYCGSAAFGLLCSCKEVTINNVKFPRNTREEQKRQCTRCHDNIKMLSRLIMVDQLWMWILDEKTILTFFPRRYGVNRQDASGIHKAIRNRLKQARNKQIRSVFDLALIILSECTKTFFDRTRTPDMQPRVLDLFSEAIGRVTHNQTIAFNHMWESAEKLRRASSIPSSADLSDLHIPLLNIAPEGMLQREIKDILDELGIMLHLVEQQKAVLEKFVKNVKTILNDEDGKPDPDCNEKSPALRWFETSSEELTADLTSHHLELESLKQSATSTSEGLDHLMSLKNQQASVIQAWQAIRQGEEAVKQGRAIMIFTTMTIIFLPLAFIAAIFGMNNSVLTPGDDDPSQSPMSFKKQLKLMFGISIGIIVVVMVFAFSTLARAWCWSACHKTSIWLVTRLGIYRFWLKKRKLWGSESRFKLAEVYEKNAKARESGAARKRYANQVEMERFLKAQYIEKKKKNPGTKPQV